MKEYVAEHMESLGRICGCIGSVFFRYLLPYLGWTWVGGWEACFPWLDGEGEDDALVEVEVGGGYVEVEGGFQRHEFASEENY